MITGEKKGVVGHLPCQKCLRPAAVKALIIRLFIKC